MKVPLALSIGCLILSSASTLAQASEAAHTLAPPPLVAAALRVQVRATNGERVDAFVHLEGSACVSWEDRHVCALPQRAGRLSASAPGFVSTSAPVEPRQTLAELVLVPKLPLRVTELAAVIQVRDFFAPGQGELDTLGSLLVAELASAARRSSLSRVQLEGEADGGAPASRLEQRRAEVLAARLRVLGVEPVLGQLAGARVGRAGAVTADAARPPPPPRDPRGPRA